jgi:hypothetical protein
MTQSNTFSLRELRSVIASGSRPATTVLLACLALSACGAPLHETGQPSAPASHGARATNAAFGEPVRVVVKFKQQTTPYRDAAFLQDMGRQIQARIAYVASVSPDTHVYQVEPRLGQSQADLIRQLSGLPAVARAEADAVARPS